MSNLLFCYLIMKEQVKHFEVIQINNRFITWVVYKNRYNA